MKNIVITLSALIILVVIQICTYQTIASEKLAGILISNLKIEKDLHSDTILLNSIIAACGNEQHPITPYNLHLSTKETLQLIQTKNPTYTIINASDYRDSCSKLIIRKFNGVESNDFGKLINIFPTSLS